MTSKEYRAAILALGLSQIQAAGFLGVSERTSRNYAAEGPPYHVAMLLRLLIARKISTDAATALMS